MIDTLTQEFWYSKIGALGNPHHGLLVGGKLLLPETVQIVNKLGNLYLLDGKQVFWSSTYNRYYLPLTSPTSASSLYIKKPGIAPIVRTPEEQAWDQARGYVWRNDGIIYGGRFYGKSLGSPDKRFLFFGTDGSRWLIDVSGITITDGNTLGGSISATRFGEFGTAPEIFTTPVSVSDLGQATPTLFYSGGIDFQNDNPATQTIKATTVRVLDTTSSGDKAVLGVYDEQARSAANPALGRWSDWDGYKYNAVTFWPVGFVELSLEHNPNGSPKITASCTVLKTREDVLGTYSHSASPMSLISTGPSGTRHYGRPVINDIVTAADRILRMGYTKTGSLFETTLSFSQTIAGSTEYDIGAQGEVGGFTGSTTTTATIALSVGNQQKAITYSGSSNSATRGGPFPLNWTNTVAAEHFASTYSSGGDYTLSHGFEGETPTITYPSATAVGFLLFSPGGSQSEVNWRRYQLPNWILATLLDASTAQVGDIAAVKFNLGLQGNKLAVHRAKAYRELDGSQNGLLYSDVHYLKSALSYNGRVDHATPNDIFQEFVAYSSAPAAFGTFDPYNETIHWPYSEPVWVV